MNYLFSKYLLNNLFAKHLHVLFLLLTQQVFMSCTWARLGNIVMGKKDIIPTLIKLPVFHFTGSPKLSYFWISYFCIDNSSLRIPSVLVTDLPGNNLLIGLYYWMFICCLAQTSTKNDNCWCKLFRIYLHFLTNYNLLFCQSS